MDIKKRNVEYKQVKDYINKLKSLYNKIFYLERKVYSLPDNAYYLFPNGLKLSNDELQNISDCYKNQLIKLIEICGQQQFINPGGKGPYGPADEMEMTLLVENNKLLPKYFVQLMKQAKFTSNLIKHYKELYKYAPSNEYRNELIDEIKRLTGRIQPEQERIILHGNTQQNKYLTQQYKKQNEVQSNIQEENYYNLIKPYQENSKEREETLKRINSISTPIRTIRRENPQMLLLYN